MFLLFLTITSFDSLCVLTSALDKPYDNGSDLSTMHFTCIPVLNYHSLGRCVDNVPFPYLALSVMDVILLPVLIIPAHPSSCNKNLEMKAFTNKISYFFPIGRAGGRFLRNPSGF